MTHLDIPIARAFLPLLEEARYKGAYGGRGSAKSTFFAEYIIERCVMQKTLVVCCREVQKSIKNSVKRLLENKIELLGIGNLFEVQDQVIKGKNGSLIIFQGLQSHTSDSIKSLEGFDIAFVEEAQTISQKSLDLLRPTMRKPGSELLFAWNPHLPTDPIDMLLRGDNPPPNSVVIEVNYDQNPWLPQELIDEMEYDRIRDPDKYAHIWLGQYLQNTKAKVFSNWKIEEFERPPGTVFRLGADWGFSVDPSVLVRCSIEGNILYIDYEAYQIGCEIVNLPELFMSVPESEKWPIVADSARPETISHMKNNGFPHIRSAIKGAKSLEEGVEFMKSYDIVVHPRCKHTIDELTMYSYKVDNLTGDILPLLDDKDNHIIDACVEGNSLISMRNGFKKIKDVQIGDEVLTRGGYQKVIDAGITGINQEVINIDGLWCTKDHKIWVENKQKFLFADAIRYNDSLLIDLEYTKWQLQNNKSLTAKFTLGILKALDHLTGITLGTQEQKGLQRFYTVKFGSKRTEKYRLVKGIMYIILTGIQQTMTSVILSLLPQKNISINTLMMTGGINSESGWTALDPSQKTGTQVKKGESFTEKLAHWPIRTISLLPSIVNGAKKNLWLKESEGVVNTVTQTVKQKQQGKEQKTDVYNLTIANHHEFFANGILVHNCRYALEGARRALKNNKPVLEAKKKPALKPRNTANSWMG